MDTRETFISAIKSQAGRPYIWGGQAPATGFDCSGLIVWAMREAGRKTDDLSAAGLYDEYHRNKVLPAAIRPGCLAFYGNTEDIAHVMVVIDVWPVKYKGLPAYVVCGARGGDSGTKSIDIAAAEAAFVDVRFGNEYWLGGLKFFVDPFPRGAV